jgi:glucokinase
MTTDALAIGVDIGGTKIAFALVDEQGQVLITHRLPTKPEEGAEAVFERIASGIHYLLERADRSVAGIGIGSPGQLNPTTGVVHSATNLAWDAVPLRDGVRQRLSVDLPVWLEKDTNAAALGEMYFGAARGCSDFVLAAVGTGLGGGAVIGGELVRGGHFVAMEIGHMPFNPSGRLCLCGMHGCPEMYISGVGLLGAVREYLPEYPNSALANGTALTTTAILDAARAGDAMALRVMNEASEWLAGVLICCIGILNPSLFVIGGGLGLAGREWYLDGVRREIMRRTMHEIHPMVKIVESQLADSAVGAACLVWHEMKLHISKSM